VVAPLGSGVAQAYQEFVGTQGLWTIWFGKTVSLPQAYQRWQVLDSKHE
jgi:hypothetical protein